MNRVLESRVTTGLQLFGILALLVSIFILFAAADRLRHNRNQMVLAGETTQVLTELKNLPQAQSADGFNDETARLIGYGDVQIDEISSMSGDGLFSREPIDLKNAKAALVQAWKTTRRVFASGTGSVAQAHADNRSAPGDLQQQFAQLMSSFNTVFSAIARDTLSPDLLTANSQLFATLRNLEFILSNRDSINSGGYSRLLQTSLSTIEIDVARLLTKTTTNTGGSLIGYETRNQLSDFASRVEQFRLQAVSLAPDGKLPAQTASEGQQLRLADTLEKADAYQRLLEFASHQNRRAILFAIAALCFALICLMLSLWRSWRSQSMGNVNDSTGLDQLRSELTAIADGNLGVRASLQRAPALNAIAQATNHTVEMLSGLVRLFRRAADNLNELAASQQLLAKRWIRSELRRHELFDTLSHNLQLQAQSINQLHELEASHRANSQSGKHDERVDERSVDDVRNLMLSIDACRDLLSGGNATTVTDDGSAVADDLTGEGLLKMRQRLHELSGSISAVRLSAEQARLQVLNTSLQMTAYAGTAEIDDQSKLVADIQNVSNQLASTAAGAERMSSALADDLQQYAEACANNRYQLVSQLDELRQSANSCLASQMSRAGGVSDSNIDESSSSAQRDHDNVAADSKSEAVPAALEQVQHQQTVLQQLLDELQAEADTVSDGDAIKLLEQIGEMQKVSASLARSADQYGSAGN